MSNYLYKKYSRWIDESIYEGLDNDECDELQDKLAEKYGVPCVLRPDAPPEAVAAWKEDGRITGEAWAKGIIID